MLVPGPSSFRRIWHCSSPLNIATNASALSRTRASREMYHHHPQHAPTIKTTNTKRYAMAFTADANDEVERRGASLTKNKTDLSRSSTSLLGPPKTGPAIARTDC